ncbi:MAG: poly-beta-1,6 N-acetyl-D-glucosamine export porin PgaA [Alphaproteobacteria bacterium]|nr:poly-beta-1,6 N-acetyl-D-glucosamine export porin PgaA [Alphaproteobacteria bacterium]
MAPAAKGFISQTLRRWRPRPRDRCLRRLTMLRHASLLAVILVGLGAGLAAATPARDVADHRRAVALAREGKLEPAVALLDDVRRRAPDYAPAAQDAVIVLGWAGRHEEALRLFDSLRAPVPTYVIGAAARSARDLRDYDRALRLYRDATAREYRGGDPTPFVAGEVLVLADANRGDVAVNRADADLTRRKRSADVLEAAAYAELRAGRPFDALSRTNAVLQIEPERRESLRRRALLLSIVGAPEQALEQALARRKLFTAAEIRELEGDAAAAMVRRGPLPTESEATRFVAIDKAIARLDALIERWRGEGAEAEPNIRRARLDRLIALRDRARMRDVIAEYEALGADELPAYIRKAAAGAYLHLRRPERARDLYRGVLRESPDDFDATRGLIYSLVETERFDEALTIVDDIDGRQGPWLWLKGAAEPEPNERKLETETLAANLRLYADRLGEAQERFETMSAIAPSNARLRAGLANTYLARGWPRRAAEEAAHGLAHDPEDRDLALARGNAELRRRDWRAAEATQAELAGRFPEDSGVEKLQRDWRLSRMGELRVVAGPTFSSGTGTGTGDGFAVESTLYAPPVAQAWRPFATGRIARSRVAEGTVLLRQLGAGLEWRQLDYEASLQASLADFGPSRAGLRGTIGWTPGDSWSFGAFGEIFAADTPLRALKNGITANALGVAATWRRDEGLSVRGAVQALDFSDGNLRLDATLRGQHRLHSTPSLSIDGAMTFGLVSNSDPGGPYFAPRRAMSAAPELAVQHTLMRRYETSWTHRLVVAPGVSWQEDFGTSFTPEVRYEHRWRPTDTLEIALVGRFSRPVYDGQPENVFAAVLELSWRF